MEKILSKKENDFSPMIKRYKVRVLINVGESRNKTEVYFGPGISSLLHQIKQYGTILTATQNMGMAYSKGWKIIRNIENGLGFQLVERHPGRGYGTSLTPMGDEFLSNYDAFVDEVNRSAEICYQKYFNEYLKAGKGQRLGPKK